MFTPSISPLMMNPKPLQSPPSQSSEIPQFGAITRKGKFQEIPEHQTQERALYLADTLKNGWRAGLRNWALKTAIQMPEVSLKSKATFIVRALRDSSDKVVKTAFNSANILLQSPSIDPELKQELSKLLALYPTNKPIMSLTTALSLQNPALHLIEERDDYSSAYIKQEAFVKNIIRQLNG